MPHASPSPPFAFDTLAEVAAALRRDGGRFSASRRKVLEALFAADGPVSADHIAGGLEGRTSRLDLTSVYRTLERLEQLGVVRHVHIGHGPGLYALAGSAEREYLVCERCHGVTTVDAARLDSARAAIREATGYDAHFRHFPIVGMCPDCTALTDRTALRRAESNRATKGGEVTHDERSHQQPQQPHTHEHAHGDAVHAHPHTEHDHEHVEHDHEHSHGDRMHSHPHIHQEGLVDQHEHEHEH